MDVALLMILLLPPEAVTLLRGHQELGRGPWPSIAIAMLLKQRSIKPAFRHDVNPCIKVPQLAGVRVMLVGQQKAENSAAP